MKLFRSVSVIVLSTVVLLTGMSIVGSQTAGGLTPRQDNSTGFALPDSGTPGLAYLSAPKTVDPDKLSQPIGEALADEIATGMGFSKTDSLTNQQYLEFVSGGGVGGDQARAVLLGQSVGLFINNYGFPLYTTVNGRTKTYALSSFGLIVDPKGKLQSLANESSPSKAVNQDLAPGPNGYMGVWCRANGCQHSIDQLYLSAYTAEVIFGNEAQKNQKPVQLVTNTKDGSTAYVGMSMSPSIWLVNFILLYTLNPKFGAQMPSLWTPIPADIAAALEADVDDVRPAAEQGKVDFSSYESQLPNYEELLKVIAGDGTQGTSAPVSGPARDAALSQPTSSAVDSDGNVYIADTGNNVIEKVTPSGELSVIAGGGAIAPAIGGQATTISLSSPSGVAIDAQGNLFIADTGHDLVLKVTPDGVLSVIAGGGGTVPSTTPTTATATALNQPHGLAVDGNGNVYIADTGNNVIERVTPAGVLTVIAGGGASSPTVRGLATSTQLTAPEGVAVDADGNVYIADTGANLVEVVDLEVTPTGALGSGKINVLAGGGTMSPQESQASTDWATHFGLGTNIRLSSPSGIAVDASGIVYVADTGNNVVARIACSIFSVVAGGGVTSPKILGQATHTQLNGPTGIALNAAGQMYVTDSGNNMVERIDGVVTAGVVRPAFTG